MTHPNAMIAWAEIACQRGCEYHASRQLHIELGGDAAHGYFDYAQVPRRLHTEFDLLVWDPEEHPVDGGPYCPAHDAVSETIVSHRVWEPRETILALQVLSTAEKGQLMLDLGAQLGWYSLLALSQGVTAMAWEADPRNAAMLRASIALNDWDDPTWQIMQERIGPETKADWSFAPIRFAKLDLEGAEEQAIRMLWPAIEAGTLDHMLMEVSPCFADGYPELVQKIIDAGYEAYVLPEKHQPPWGLDDLPADLDFWRLDTAGDPKAVVASWHQEDVWFVRSGASW